MTCGISAPGGRSEVCDGPQHVHLALHRSQDSDRLVNEDSQVGDDEDRQDDLQGAREAWTSPEIGEPKRTEDQEEQDQDPPRAVVPLERGGRPLRGHDGHSARRAVTVPEEDDDQ
jgi:hypothetical protein